MEAFSRLGSLLGASWGCLGPLLGRLGALLGRFGALLGRLGALLGSFRALLGASWALLGRSLEPPGPFSAVLGPTKRNPEKHSKTIEKSMIFASSGPLGKPLGGHLGRLGGLLDRLGAILGRLGGVLDRLGPNLGVLERSWTVLEPSWTPLGPSWSRLGALLLKMCVLPCEFDDLCRFCRCVRRKRAIRPGPARERKELTTNLPEMAYGTLRSW